MPSGTLNLEFYGRLADDSELDVYDASRSMLGMARTVGILAHYYETGEIISHAPRSVASVRVRAPRPGSWWLEVLIGCAGSILATPPVYFITKLMDGWNPNSAAKAASRETALRHRLEVKGLEVESLERALAMKQETIHLKQEFDRFRENHQVETDVLRSILAISYRDIFRPIGRSADYSVIFGDVPGSFGGVMNASSVAELEADIPDDDTIEVSCVVNGFSRTSKVGVAFANELGRGFRFSADKLGKLGRQDDFSWSQFTGREITMTGRFYRFHDGKIRRLEVYGVERRSVI